MPVGLPPAVSSVPKTPANCRPKGEGDAAGGEQHSYLKLLSLLAGPHEMVTPEALHKWGSTKRRRGPVRARRSRGVQHGGKGWRRRAGEPRHHHRRHRIRRCSLILHSVASAVALHASWALSGIRGPSAMRLLRYQVARRSLESPALRRVPSLSPYPKSHDKARNASAGGGRDKQGPLRLGNPR
jgi:hypothetical protein